MKQNWIELTWPQRIVIIIQAFLVLLFLILYLAVGRQQVIEYRDEYLRYRTDGAVTTYSGKLNGEKAVFTVTENTVEYQLGDTRYGPYTVRSNPTAVPSEENKPWNTTSTSVLVGVEVWEGDTLLYRGAYHDVDLGFSSTFYLVDTEGEIAYGDEKVGAKVETGFGELHTYIDKEEPGPYTILKISRAPGVVRRGHFGMYVLGVFLCILNAISVLYADAFFRWNLRFRISNVEDAEPSEWELFSRWIGWFVLTVCALVIFILGLNYA